MRFGSQQCVIVAQWSAFSRPITFKSYRDVEIRACSAHVRLDITAFAAHPAK
jgi:hypothetical protein